MKTLVGLLIAPLAITIGSTAYLLGAHWLLKRLGVDTTGGWYAVNLAGSLLLILLGVAELSP